MAVVEHRQAGILRDPAAVQAVDQPEATGEREAGQEQFGEGHEVQVDIPPELDNTGAIAHMWKEFHKVHDRTFGFHYEGEQDVELVNLRVQAVGAQHRPTLKPDGSERAPAKPFASRKAYWRRSGWVDCPLYRRSELAAGQGIEGPVIVEEYGSTVVVPAGWAIRSDAYGNLILEKAE